jgi:hypothetical protein
MDDDNLSQAATHGAAGGGLTLLSRWKSQLDDSEASDESNGEPVIEEPPQATLPPTGDSPEKGSADAAAAGRKTSSVIPPPPPLAPPPPPPDFVPLQHSASAPNMAANAVAGLAAASEMSGGLSPMRTRAFGVTPPPPPPFAPPPPPATASLAAGTTATSHLSLPPLPSTAPPTRNRFNETPFLLKSFRTINSTTNKYQPKLSANINLSMMYKIQRFTSEKNTTTANISKLCP